MLAYIWLEKEKAEEILAKGMKPEGEGVEGLALPRAGKEYIAALLHPADTFAGGGEADHVCLRLDIDRKTAYVIDAGRMAGRVQDTLTPADKYVFGSFRRPLLIITAPVRAEDIKRYEGNIDAPLLYENSEKIYIDRQFALIDDIDPAFREIALRAYYEKQTAAGRGVKYSGASFPVPEKIKNSKKEEKSSKNGFFRRFTGAGRGGRDKQGATAESGGIAEIVEEYVSPDGKLIGVNIEKKPVKG